MTVLPGCLYPRHCRQWSPEPYCMHPKSGCPNAGARGKQNAIDEADIQRIVDELIDRLRGADKREIERLRAENATLRAALNRIVTEWSEGGPDWSTRVDDSIIYAREALENNGQ